MAKLHVLVSVCVLNNKPVEIVADSLILTFIFWLCLYLASSTCLTPHFWLQPGVTEMTVGVWFSEKIILNGGKIS